MFKRRTGLYIFLILLGGCSFQAHKPAPVENISFESGPAYRKGSIDGTKYQVKRGDTLYSIAWGADKDFLDIAKMNGLKEPFTIYPGQWLTLTPISISTKSRTVKSRSPVKLDARQKSPVPTSTAKNHTKVGNSVIAQETSKKSLANKNGQPYSVTSAQHPVNKVNISTGEVLPQKVSRWVWPVQGKLIGTFSPNGQGNKGVKIAGERGAVIQSAAEGRVVYAGNALRGYGNLVIIKHSDNYLSAYAHADKILVKEKQRIDAGQAVATMGSTGTNKVMLHFEIRYHGQSVNPLKYLPEN
ncbi:MAG: peptidoglycan DD-metalloendopeptidase family protein [Shewanella sp.]|nr:peptidoglycan DD-metalloendopeptidase family protein [Shewanella sp.]MCF1429465.1 peptidoglycan DD-metalloendopeptidase family protein [Shewanella sp.]MCF1437458.1 peptidoglycan DD-metalloendopeptidase family protein [Shewanella sp.]MCF1456656.1 peptidoglycan DD-metalloendopeptidase family protein [Shewanella sp.]